ncbi:hypothetical protein, partial [Nocardiopsis sp. CNR-923]|uniref:hypothetical protein n=1 Tax=Nocardiopsis sp. CNR-923 TaxID=1904965 RepID=UPI0021CC7DA8
LAEAMSPELAEEFRALDPNSPWEASAVRQPEMAVPGGGPDTPNTTITNSSQPHHDQPIPTPGSDGGRGGNDGGDPPPALVREATTAATTPSQAPSATTTSGRRPPVQPTAATTVVTLSIAPARGASKIVAILLLAPTWQKFFSAMERDRESGFWTQSESNSNLDPDDPILRRDEIALRLDQAGLNQQQQDALIENLINNKSNEGRQVAEIIHSGALQGSTGFSDFLVEMTSRSQDAFRGHAAELRFSYDLTQQGYPSSRIEFPSKNTDIGDDVDVSIRGIDGEVEYSYQIKSVETANGVRKKWGEVIRQLSGETAGTTNRVGIFEVQQEMSNLNERTRRAMYAAAVDSGVSFRLYFTDGTITIPPDVEIYPE